MKEQFTDHHNQKIYLTTLFKIRSEINTGEVFPSAYCNKNLMSRDKFCHCSRFMSTILIEYILDNLEIILTLI